MGAKPWQLLSHRHGGFLNVYGLPPHVYGEISSTRATAQNSNDDKHLIGLSLLQKNAAESSPLERPSHVLNDSEGHLIYKTGDILDERCK